MSGTVRTLDAALEERIGYRFQNRALFAQALTHRSFEHEKPRAEVSSPRTATPQSDNEQLEFLGDSILGFVASDALFRALPNLAEGQLSQRKAHLVSATHLYSCALELGLGDHLRLGRGEERNGGRARRTLLANAIEAIIAAIYLDGGLESARDFIHRHVLNDLHTVEELDATSLLNYKSLLQEKAQANGLPPPRYTVVQTEGPEHAKEFTVEVTIGSQYTARATSTSKKSASQLAAQMLWEELAAANWKFSAEEAETGMTQAIQAR